MKKFVNQRLSEYKMRVVLVEKMSQNHHNVLALALVKILQKLPVFIQPQFLMVRLLLQ